jgi:retron-type reverse transcriptase
MLSLQALYVAYKQVKKNRGAAGIDGQSIDDFTQNLEKELNQLLLELKEKRYQAQPVKRVEIDKDDGGKRLLGIPTVRDRIVQQCLSNIMTPIFDPQFHPVMGIALGEAVIKLSAKRRYLYASITSGTLLIWICLNVLICSIMT